MAEGQVLQPAPASLKRPVPAGYTPTAQPSSERSSGGSAVFHHEVAEVGPSDSCKAARTAGSSVRRCGECGASETPQWRQGPTGPQSLCNACGVRHSRQSRKGKGSRRGIGGGDMYEMSPMRWESGTESDTYSRGSSHMSRGNSQQPVLATGHLSASPLQPKFLQLPVLGPVPSHLPPLPPTRLLARPASSAPEHIKEEHSLPPARPAYSQSAYNQGNSSEVLDQDCQAALDLLSMASGEQPVADSSVAEMDVLSRFQGGTVSRLLPQLSPEQLQELCSLLQTFDTLYKEMVAACAARDAVSKILMIKQQESHAAEVNASNAAYDLYQEARKLAPLNSMHTKGAGASRFSITAGQ